MDLTNRRGLQPVVNRSPDAGRTRWARRVLGNLTLAGICAALSLPGTAAPVLIDHLSAVDGAGRLVPGPASAGLNDHLAVVLAADPGTAIDPAKAMLYLDGRAIAGLADTIYRSDEQALVFHLLRNGDNAASWQPLLAAPSFTPRAVVLGLALEAPAAGTAPSLLTTVSGAPAVFELLLLSRRAVVAAALAVLLVVIIVWVCARRTNLLRDAMLPQLAPDKQPYSLGRTQMAFWFALVFAGFASLYCLLADYNTLTSQALMLMGLSSATAVFAVAIDANKDTPIGAANETLQAMGLRTYRDIEQLSKEIAERQAQLRATPPPDAEGALRLQTEITDRFNKLRSVQELTRRYVSQGWWHDLTTDINGPALHRLQVLVWTATFGVLFVIDLYRTLAMPQFSELQLALMGITSAGYLGFKYPEQQH